MSTIYEFVREQRDSYRSDTIEITEGYEFSQYETLRTIELYHNSKFLTGNKDSQGREKPFYNICKFRVNVATRATDLAQNRPYDYSLTAQGFFAGLRIGVICAERESRTLHSYLQNANRTLSPSQNEQDYLVACQASARSAFWGDRVAPS
jgi:hypothetical protein